MITAPLPEGALLEVMRGLEARLIRRGDEDVPYLWRAYLGERKGDPSATGAFLHRFVSSDVRELHCHPWAWARTFILAGSYSEDRASSLSVDFVAKRATLDGSTWRTEVFRPGDTNVIYGSTFHRVDLLTPEVWTLFVHGPRVQDWGFVPMHRFAEPVPMRVIEGHTRDRLAKEAVE